MDRERRNRLEKLAVAKGVIRLAKQTAGDVKSRAKLPKLLRQKIEMWESGKKAGKAYKASDVLNAKSIDAYDKASTIKKSWKDWVPGLGLYRERKKGKLLAKADRLYNQSTAAEDKAWKHEVKGRLTGRKVRGERPESPALTLALAKKQ